MTRKHLKQTSKKPYQQKALKTNKKTLFNIKEEKMHPHITIGPFIFPSYTLMLILGAISFALYYIFNVEKREKMNKITSNRLLFTSLVGFAVLGFSALVFNSVFHSIEEGKLVIGGITWLGGVIGVIPAMYFLIHFIVPKERGNEINRFSTMLPGLVIAHAFGRVGCFLGGCCYGGPTNLPIGVVYPAGSLAGHDYPDLSTIPVTETVLDSLGNEEIIEHYQSLPLMPTQLIEAIFEILLFAVMLILYKWLKDYNVELYCFAYGTFRFVIELWRGDSRGDTGIFISPSQLMSLILIVFATLLILYRKGIIFKSLYYRCERWKSEAVGTPANAPIFPTVAKRSIAPLYELFPRIKSGELDREEFDKRKGAILDTVCDISKNNVSVSADAIREVRHLHSEGILTDTELSDIEGRLVSNMCEALAVETKQEV